MRSLTNCAPVALALGLALTIGSRTVQAGPVEGFESGFGDWFTDSGVWEIGAPIGWPDAPHNGSAVAGTVLDANYPSNTDSRLIGPPCDLPTIPAGGTIELRYWQAYSYGLSDYGQTQLQVWNGTSWGEWEALATSAPGGPGCGAVQWSDWAPVSIDLAAYEGQTVRFGFLHHADDSSGCSGSDTSLGWYIDDVEVVDVPPPFAFSPGFELGWGDWSTDTGVWEIGAPGLWPHSAEPLRANQRCQVAATVLDGAHPSNTDSRLISPPCQLATGPVVRLCFWQAYSYGLSDSGDVQVSVLENTAWGPWQTVGTPAPGGAGCGAVQWSDWSRICVDLSAFGGQTVRIAFFHHANDSSGCSGSDASVGWFIDTVEIDGCLSVCRGDVDDDNDTDIFDFGVLAPNFGKSVPPGAGGDLNCDGVVDIIDFSILAPDFSCTP